MDGNTPILVFDVGGSHIAASFFDPSSMSLGTVHTVSVVESGSAEDFFSAFKSLAVAILPPATPAGVAIAIPNPFNYQAGVSYMRHKYRQLYSKDLRRGLAERLKCDPLRIHFLNDAAAFLMGELHQGAAVGVDRVVGITLGTGVGSAFSVRGKVVTNGCGVPHNGEVWDLAYRDGTVENFISTRSIQSIFQQLTGTNAEVRDIAALGLQDKGAGDTFEAFGKELGRVLKETCSEFAPQRIVLGGGISHAAELFLPAAERELKNSAIQLRISDLFERAPLVGAAVSWNMMYGNRQPQEPEPSGIAEGR